MNLLDVYLMVNSKFIFLYPYWILSNFPIVCAFLFLSIYIKNSYQVHSFKHIFQT